MHPDSVPLARATLHYLATLTGQGYSPETVRLYGDNLADFAAFVGEAATLGDLTLERALLYQQHLQRRPRKATPLNRRPRGGLSPYTIHQRGRALRSFASWLWRHGYLEANRLADFHPGRLPEREVEPLSPAEQQQVLAAMDQDTYADARGRAIVLTLLDSGVRASELCGLTLDGLDLATGEVRVRRGKGGKARHVAVGMRTLAALHVYVYRYRPEPALPALGEPVFLTQDGYPLTRGSLYLCIRRLRKRCGIPRLTVHLFRHTFAVSYLKAGGDVLTLQRILGHTSLRMVNHYMHLAHSDVVARHRRHSPVDRLQLPRAVDRVTRGRSRQRRRSMR